MSHKSKFPFLLLLLQLGFDSVHFARVDYQDRAKRKVDKSLEVVWRGSKTFGSFSQVRHCNCFSVLGPFFFLNGSLLHYSIFFLQIFSNAFPRHYSPPDGFHFEVLDEDFVPVQVLN